MLGDWKAKYGQWVLSGGYALVLLVGLRLESAEAMRWVVIVTALLALTAWQAALHRARRVSDTPTSTIRAAAQGYTELQGTGQTGKTPVFEPLRRMPCLWYSYTIEKRQGDKWVKESSDTSEEPFRLNDGTGLCWLAPWGAEVLTRDKETWEKDDHRYTLSLIVPNTQVYVLGIFSTLGGNDLNLDHRQDVANVLNAWKSDMPALLRRYDSNGNGQLDMDEWEQVRQAAQAEVARDHADLRTQPDEHHMGKPADGRLFLISTLPPEKIVQRFRRWAWAHATAFLACLVGLVYLI